MQVALSRTADDEYRAENHDGIVNKINNKCGINIFIIIKIFIVIVRVENISRILILFFLFEGFYFIYLSFSLFNKFIIKV